MILRAFRKGAAKGRANVATPAAFGDTAADRERLDWVLFQNGGVVLYHKHQVLTEHTAWLVRESYQLRELDANGWKDARAFHEDAKRVFAFPNHYAHNLASLVDALTELEIGPGGAVAVQIRRYDRFVKSGAPPRVVGARRARDDIATTAAHRPAVVDPRPIG